MRHLLFALLLCAGLQASAQDSLPDAPAREPLQFIPVRNVELVDVFWRKRLQAIRRVTLPRLLQTLPTDTVQTQAEAIRLCRVIETMANILLFAPDSVQAVRLDSLAACLTARQQPDGDFTFLKDAENTYPFEPALSTAAMAYSYASDNDTLRMALRKYRHVPQRNTLKEEPSLAAFSPTSGNLNWLLTQTANGTLSAAALDTLWHTLSAQKMQLTGVLPIDTKSNSALAALRFAKWNLLRYQQTADARYMDVLERVLFNAVLSAFGTQGDMFFTQLPQENISVPERKPWGRNDVLPAELSSFISGITGYMSAVCGRDVFLNIYTRGTLSVLTDSLDFQLIEKSSYPWSGDVAMAFSSKTPQRCTLYLRVPGWITDQTVDGSGRYPYISGEASCQLIINNEVQHIKPQNGYYVISRLWSDGDFIGLRFPMKTRRVSNGKNRLAFQRGPFVFALEETDQPDIELSKFYFDPTTLTHTEFRNGFLDNVQTLSGTLRQKRSGVEGSFLAIPYYAIGTRGGGHRMKIWLEDREYLNDEEKTE